MLAWTLCASAVAAPAQPSASPEAVEFDDQFLRQPGGPAIDFSRFNKGNVALPGFYTAEFYANEGWIGRVRLQLRQVGREVQPCFDRALVERIGVDPSKLLLQPVAPAEAEAGCTTLAQWVAGASATFDPGEQRLDASVPQVALKRTARGDVDPQYWDDGVTAARLQYDASSYTTGGDGSRSRTQGFVGLDGGVNLGAWRLRHTGNFSSSSGGDPGGTRYQPVRSFAQRSVRSMRSQLLVGDGFTDGTLFDSVGFRGLQLASDDRMLPESRRGYAPVVRGIAHGNARVQIRQNGNLLYETTVAAGAFEIGDLYPTGYGGDLEVRVTEADGRVFVSRVPWANAVNALRPGVTRYSLTAGRYRHPQVQEAPLMAEATLTRGFSNLLTGYGGLSLSAGHAAVLGGMALNTRYGALGVDLTHARTQQVDGSVHDGQSLRLGYARRVDRTNTSLSLSAARDTGGYLGLADAMARRDLERRGLRPASTGPRDRLQLLLNQVLADGHGSVYLSGSLQRDGSGGGTGSQFQLGWSSSYQRIDYGVSAARQYDAIARRRDTALQLTVSLPLGDGPARSVSSSSLQHDPRGATSLRQTLSGSLGEDDAFNYSLGANASAARGTGSARSLAGSVGYASPMASLSANASGNGRSHQFGAGVSGVVVAYGGGLAFAPLAGDTLAVVEAKDAAGARIANGSGLRVDPWGRALVTSLTPYAVNSVDIDPKGLPVNVQLRSTEQRTTPTAGAVTVVRFETDNTGRAAIVRASRPDGQPLPFGAQAFDEAGREVGIVAQGGRVIARGLREDRGSLQVRWGPAPDERCRLDYALPAESRDSTRYEIVRGICE